ncbi:MAG TPA: 50S ribosomal protein L29 [Halobacteria archaeon]|nr:50S ribosomal protein L29 [Halobacteria archaeon]HIH78351.1 50S ribosomal protein L29 [Halobacteria archaeon]
MLLVVTKASEIREMDRDKREKTLKNLQYNLIKRRGEISSGGALKNPGEIKEIRRAIARIKTVENEIRRKERD